MQVACHSEMKYVCRKFLVEMLPCQNLPDRLMAKMRILHSSRESDLKKNILHFYFLKTIYGLSVTILKTTSAFQLGLQVVFCHQQLTLWGW